VSPVKYKQGFYIQEDDILHSDRRETSSLTYLILLYGEERVPWNLLPK
jgi:hypothetical protein